VGDLLSVAVEGDVLLKLDRRQRDFKTGEVFSNMLNLGIKVRRMK
jgi:hypothetical protein